MKDQLNQANSTVEQTKNDVDSSKQFVDEAKSGYESADAEASAKEDAANKAEADTKEGSEEYDAVNKDLTDKKAEVDSAKELLDEKTADVEEKKGTVEEAKKALDEANTELEGKKTELENAKSNVTNKEKALEDAKKALDTAKGDTTEKLQAVEDAKQALLDAQTKAKEAEDAYNEAVNNQEDAQIALEKAKVDAENAEKVQDAAQKAFDNASIYQKVVFGTDESLYPYISEVNRTLDLRPAEAGDSAVTYRVYHKKGETSEVNDYYSRQIKSTGVITPIIETWYWHNSGSGLSYGSMEKPDDMTNVTVENKTLAGTYYIVAEWEGGSKQYLVEIKDYKTEYCNQTVANKNTEIISSVNTEGMSEEEKIRAITKYIAENYKYDARHSSAYTMYQNGGGDCWASTDAIVRLAKQLGFEAWSYDARYEGGAGSGHANAMVKTSDGRYFVCEAGFSQYNADGKRPFAVNEVDPYDVNSGTLFRVNAPDITDVVVPEGVTEIGEIPSRNGTFSAVSGVNKLNSVRVSSTVTDIAVSNFTAAGNLADWTVDENNSTFSGNAHGDILSKDGTALYHANPKTAVLEIPSTVKTMKEYAIYGWNAETQQIILNEGLETLEQGAIYYTKVKKIVFPSTLKYVDKYALFQHESGSTFVFKSMDTVFDADALNTNSQLFTSSDTIIAPKGSTAEAAAKACGAKYVELSADTDLSLPEVVEKPKVTKTEKLTITNKSDAETQAEIAKAQAELDAAKKDYAAKKGIYDSLLNGDNLAKINAAKKAMEEAKANVKEAEKNVENAKANKEAADKAQASANEAVNQAQTTLNEANAKVTQLLTNMTTYEDAVESKKSTLASTNAELTNAIANQGAAQSNLDKANAELENAQNRYDALFENVSKLKKEAEEARTKANEAKDAYENAVTDHDAKQEAYTKALEDAKQLEAKLQEAEEKTAQAKAAFEAAQAKADEKKAIFDEKHAVAEEARSAYDQAKTAYDTAVEDKKKAEQALRDAQTELENAEKQLEDAVSNKDVTSSNLASAKDALDKAKKALEEATNNRDNAKQPFDSLKKAYEEAKAAYDQAVRDLEDAQKAVPTKTDWDALEKAKSEAEENLKHAKWRYDEAEYNLTYAEDVLDQANAQLIVAKANYDGAVIKYDASSKQDQSNAEQKKQVAAKQEKVSKSADTADDANLNSWAYMLAGSLAVAGVAVAALRKGKKHQEEGNM